MKLQLGEIRPMIDVLPAVIDTAGLPTKTSYWLGRALVDLMREHAPYEKARQKVIKEYAKKDDDGELIIEVRDDVSVYVFDDMEAFARAVNEIAKEEVEIKYNPITIEQFGDAVIKGTVLLKLGRLIKDDDQDTLPPMSVIKSPDA